MNRFTRVALQFLLTLSLALAAVGCEADSTTEATPASSVEPEESAGGTVDIATVLPAADVPTSAAPDAGPSAEDTAVTALDTVIEPEDPEDAGSRFGNEIIVGQGACTNDSDMEALNGFDPVDDFMSVGMSCINTRSSPGETDDDELVACLVDELGTGYGFSEECGTCVAWHVVCAQANCMEMCMSFMMNGEISDECTECINDSACKSEFTGCSGLDPDAMQP